MVKNITFSEFCDGFIKYNRADSFSYEGLRVLYDYLKELEEDCGVDMEFDVLSLCCGYNEYDSIEDCARDLDGEALDTLDALLAEQEQMDGFAEDELDTYHRQRMVEYFQQHTVILHLPGGGVIIGAY